MKTLSLILLTSSFIMCTILSIAVAQKATNEKLEAMDNTEKRKTGQGLNRTAKVCAKNDLKCISEKTRNRVLEVKDATLNDSKSLNDKVD